MNFDDSKLDDYLLPDAEALDDLPLFDENSSLMGGEELPSEEWPQDLM
jgi:hypothetical protein